MLYLKDGHQPLSAVVFDLGNVMLDFNPRQFMFEMGIRPELFDRLEAVLNKSQEWLEMDRGVLSNEEFIAIATRKEPSLKKEITKFAKTWPDYFHAVPANVEALYRIKEAGVKTYILSNFMKRTFKLMEERNSFFADFDGKILSCDCHYLKPGAEIYRLLIDTYHLDPGSSVFFDDVAANIEGARAAGMLGVVLPVCAPVTDYLEFE